MKRDSLHLNRAFDYYCDEVLGAALDERTHSRDPNEALVQFFRDAREGEDRTHTTGVVETEDPPCPKCGGATVDGGLCVHPGCPPDVSSDTSSKETQAGSWDDWDG